MMVSVDYYTLYPAPPFLSVLRPTGRVKKPNPCEPPHKAFADYRE